MSSGPIGRCITGKGEKAPEVTWDDETNWRCKRREPGRNSQDLLRIQGLQPCFLSPWAAFPVYDHQRAGPAETELLFGSHERLPSGQVLQKGLRACRVNERGK
ncbi:hypothetical protein E5288_WYG005710 [Bos mutus]|uniref:Uncharacterized protein n=1 Tax=Bos mutus TaxID=72004 RepID=A0A6B0RR57_9CETA|nr:hypothetical protein [Bos mutus]